MQSKPPLIDYACGVFTISAPTVGSGGPVGVPGFTLVARQEADFCNTQFVYCNAKLVEASTEVHPDSAEGFEWDDGNSVELARHHISPPEVEEVYDNRPRWRRNKHMRAANFQMIGRTNAGRALTISVLWQEDARVIRPITGWEATRGERTRYLRG